MKKLAVIGSGDLGRLIMYHAIRAGYSFAGFFNDFEPVGKLIDGYPVIGGKEDVLNAYKAGGFDELMIGIGYRHFEVRRDLFTRFSGSVPFGTIIHQHASVADSCTIGKGCFILPGCVLDNNVCIGDNVLINVGAVIAHDSTIGDHSFLSPRVAIAGFVKVGACCNIGINATVIDNITIADNVQVGGGAVVIKSLPEAGVYVGNPVRRIK